MDATPARHPCKEPNPSALRFVGRTRCEPGYCTSQEVDNVQTAHGLCPGHHHGRRFPRDRECTVLPAVQLQFAAGFVPAKLHQYLDEWSGALGNVFGDERTTRLFVD